MSDPGMWSSDPGPIPAFNIDSVRKYCRRRIRSYMYFSSLVMRIIAMRPEIILFCSTKMQA